MHLSWRDINLHNDIANTALQHFKQFKFSSSYKIMKGGSCINFNVESSLQLQVNHGTRWARHPQESAFGKFGVPKYLSPDSRKGRSRGFSSWGRKRGGRRLSVYTGYRDFVYLPTYIGGFLPAGLPVAVSRGEYTPARRFTGVWLGESQEACALLTMTNCPALRRHIYANLGTRVESPPPSTYEFTRALLPLRRASRRPFSLLPSPTLSPSGASGRSAPTIPRDVENSVNYGFCMCAR